MKDLKTSECTGTLDFLVDDIVFKANIWPDYKPLGSLVSLVLDEISFKSTDANLPNYFSVSNGTALSVSGTGTLTLKGEEASRNVNSFYSLYLLDSNVGRENLASLNFFSIDETGAILAYAINLISPEVKVKISTNSEENQPEPTKTFSIPKESGTDRGKIIVVRNDRIEVKKL